MQTIDLGPGMVALQRGDTNGAIAGFMRTIDEQPQNVPARLMLAAILLRARSWRAALGVLSDVVRVDPSGAAIGNDPEHVDDGVAEAIIGWAKDVADAGYRDEAAITDIVRSAQTYRRVFRAHVSDVVAVEQAVHRRLPIYVDFRPRD